MNDASPEKLRPFRAWRERLGLTQAQAARILDRSKRSCEMLDHAETLSRETDLACRWLERYGAQDMTPAKARFDLENARGEGGEAVLDAASPHYLDTDIAARDAAAAAFAELEEDRRRAEAHYAATKARLESWVDQVNSLIDPDSSLDVREVLPPPPSTSTSTADLFSAAWGLVLANERVQGGGIALEVVLEP